MSKRTPKEFNDSILVMRAMTLLVRDRVIEQGSKIRNQTIIRHHLDEVLALLLQEIKV